jgi:hypothetical protein
MGAEAISSESIGAPSDDLFDIQPWDCPEAVGRKQVSASLDDLRRHRGNAHDALRQFVGRQIRQCRVRGSRKRVRLRQYRCER